MKKSSLISLFSLIALSSFAQIEKELDDILNAAAKIVCLDAVDLRNKIAKEKEIDISDIQQMESYYTTARGHCERLVNVNNIEYKNYANFLYTLIKTELGIVYEMNNQPTEAYDQLKDASLGLQSYVDDKNFFSFRFTVGDMNYSLEQKLVKSRLLDCYKALGVACAMLKKWEESTLYWHLILYIPYLPTNDIYYATSKLIAIKEITKAEDPELLNALLTNFRIISNTKPKDRQGINDYVDPVMLYDSAKALSDKHPEFGKAYEIDTTGARNFIKLGDYGRSAALFTKWLEMDIASDPLACWGIFCGIQVNDQNLVRLAIKNLEKEDYGEYCFAYQQLKEGYE